MIDQRTMGEGGKRNQWIWTTLSQDHPPDQISVLAIVETLCAVGVYTWVAMKYGTFHLTVSASIAPFLLLRTEESTELGLKCAKWVGRSTIAYTDDSRSMAINWVKICFAAPVLLVSLFLGPPLIRIFSTAVCLITNPVRSLKAIPKNWWQYVAKVDSCSAVEPIPEISALADNRDAFQFSPQAFFDSGRDRLTSRMDSASWHIANWFYFIIVMVPAFLYRWALKGTSLIYSPFIYLVHSAVNKSSRDLLLDVRDLALHRLMRVYAAITVMLFVAKMALLVGWNELAPLWNSMPAVSMRNAFVLPREIAPWQIASVVNALLTWVVFFAADSAVVYAQRSGNDVSPRLVVFIRSSWLIRGLLSFYSIACVLYISASLVPSIEWPALGAKWFPW